MGQPNLVVDWRECTVQTKALENLVASLATLSPAHQKLVAEIVMVRLFLLLDNTIRSVAAKMLCGASYVDASMPLRLVQAKSAGTAWDLMRTHGRAKPKNKLYWSQSHSIVDNLSKTLAPTDPFFGSVSQHSVIIEQMRRVRNHIAHRNDGTARDFRLEIAARYGGLRRGMTPGLFLLAVTSQSARKLDQYIITSRVIVKDIVRA